MKANKSQIKIFSVLILFIALSGLGCSGVGFSKAESSSASTAGTGNTTPPANTPPPGNSTPPVRDGSIPLDTTVTNCTVAINQITYPLKLIFVLDASGSNVGALSTDPVRQFRYGTTASFLNKFYNKANFQWQMIHFQEQIGKPKALTYMVNGSGTPTFGSSANMNTGLQYFMNQVDDGGYTPYKSALAAARTAISSSSDAANTKYAIMFITDGMPTDYVKYVSNPAGQSIVEDRNNQGLYGVVDESAILADVSNTVSTKPGIVSLSTVFYGQNDSYAPAAKQRLRNMATNGGGKFVDASQAEQIRVEDSIGIPGLVCTP